MRHFGLTLFQAALLALQIAIGSGVFFVASAALFTGFALGVDLRDYAESRA